MFLMGDYQSRDEKPSKTFSLSSCIKLFIVALLWLACWNSRLLAQGSKDTIDPWWVWTRKTEGQVIDIKPVSWKIADNSFVMEAINEDPLQNQQAEKSLHNPQSVLKMNQRTKLLKQRVKKPNRVLRMNRLKATKTILFLDWPSGTQKAPALDREKCGTCSITTQIINIAYAEAVVINSRYLLNNSFPLRSYSKQLFVWMHRASQFPLSDPTQNTDGAYNLTMTHRRTSDIYYPDYSALAFVEGMQNNSLLSNLKRLLRVKNKFVYWAPMAGGNKQAKRMAYDMIFRLRIAGLPIDVLQRRSPNGTVLPLLETSARYKFYLAFDHNWHCYDYISEDVWRNGLMVGAVPVIWGPKRSDLVDLLPRGSFIVAEDFSSSFELTNYLTYLDGEDKAFRQYFNWRETPLADTMSESSMRLLKHNGFCHLCSILHSLEPDDALSIPSLQYWWRSDDSVYCYDPPPINTYFIDYWIWIKQYTILNLEPHVFLLNLGNNFSWIVFHTMLFLALVLFYGKFVICSLYAFIVRAIELRKHTEKTV